MTKPANDTSKPSPADTPTDRPNDNGHKSKVRKEDKQYYAAEPENENIEERRENEEQPAKRVKRTPGSNFNLDSNHD